MLGALYNTSTQILIFLYLKMSIDYSKPAEFHYELAKELSSLRKKSVFIVGSGCKAHKLRLVAWNRLKKTMLLIGQQKQTKI